MKETTKVAAPDQLDKGRLTGLEEWRFYEAKIRELIEAYRLELEEARTWDEHLFKKGVLKGLRAVLTLPDELFKLEEHERARRPRRGSSWEE